MINKELSEEETIKKKKKQQKIKRQQRKSRYPNISQKGKPKIKAFQKNCYQYWNKSFLKKANIKRKNISKNI